MNDLIIMGFSEKDVLPELWSLVQNFKTLSLTSEPSVLRALYSQIEQRLSMVKVIWERKMKEEERAGILKFIKMICDAHTEALINLEKRRAELAELLREFNVGKQVLTSYRSGALPSPRVNMSG
ncbi:MAG: hypothetical protein ACK4OO_03555 [bacterium]